MSIMVYKSIYLVFLYNIKICVCVREERERDFAYKMFKIEVFVFKINNNRGLIVYLLDQVFNLLVGHVAK